MTLEQVPGALSYPDGTTVRHPRTEPLQQWVRGNWSELAGVLVSLAVIAVVIALVILLVATAPAGAGGGCGGG